MHFCFKVDQSPTLTIMSPCSGSIPFFFCFVQKFWFFIQSLNEKYQFENYWRIRALFSVGIFNLFGFSCPIVCLAQGLMNMITQYGLTGGGDQQTIFHSLSVWLLLLWEIPMALWHIDWNFPHFPNIMVHVIRLGSLRIILNYCW